MNSAKPVVLESTARQVQVIELYTSQGCSSCPPAESWFAELEQHESLWKEFVPLAFHVDYWNWLGWRDPYASKRYSKRQRLYKQLGHLNAVYTPGFVVDGREWRGFVKGAKNFLKPSSPEVGVLRLKSQKNQHELSFEASDALVGSLGNQALLVHVALLGANLQTPISAGENKGRKLKQDFVVLDWQSSKPKALQSGQQEWHIDASLQAKGDASALARYALVAWVSREGDPTPLQAVGAWYNEPLMVQR